MYGNPRPRPIPATAAPSMTFELGYALAERPDFASKLLDLPAQLIQPVGLAGTLSGVGRKEGTLALMAHREPLGFQRANRFTGNRAGDAIPALKLGQGRQLAGLGVLTSRDTPPEIIGNLLVGRPATPLDHEHPKLRLYLCPIVPKRQR